MPTTFCRTDAGRLLVLCSTIMYNVSMTTSVTVSEARAALPQLLDRVNAGEEVTITRHGRPAAVLVRPDTLRVRRADGALAVADAVRDALARGRRSPLPARPGVTRARAEALIEDVRAARSRS
jgi:antitoxin (DNA-binding transcriptional repressor) of toxin-antitoxin stability system